MGKYEEAEKHLQESLKTFKDLGNDRGQAEVLETWSNVFRKKGMISTAEEMHNSAKNLCSERKIEFIVPPFH